MANVKNFGLIGVGQELQFGKNGTKLYNDEGVFSFKTVAGLQGAEANILAGSITANSGDLIVTAGNLVVTSSTGKVTIGGGDVLEATAAGLPKLSGAAAVLVPTGATASRPGTGVAGMVRVNNDTPAASYVEFYNGTTWMTLATGGDATALQTEVNNIEATMGTMVNANGTTNVAAALTNSLFGSATDLTTALQNLATGVQGKDTLDEIFPSTGVANVIYAGAGNTWLQAAPGATSGVQAYDAGLAALAAKTSTGILVQTGADTYESRALVAPAAGLTITDASGVAGAPTFSLANDLAALEALSSTGFAVRSGTDTWVQRSLVAPAAGFTITDADGVAGSPTFALANDLAALEGLSTMGYIVRTADGSATTRSMGVVSADLVITGAANGVSTDTTFGLATVTQAATGDFVKVTLDTKGRVTGNTAVVTADVTALVDGTYVRQDGTSAGMTGSLDLGGHTITNVATPVNSTDAANKGYVDNAVTGLTWKTAANLLAVTQFAVTGTWASIAAGIDGHPLSVANVNYRLLLTRQSVPAENGIYKLTDAGSGNYALVRPTDADTYQELVGASIFVEEGTAYANTGWVQSNHYLTGFTGQQWVQFSGAGAYTGGTGITVSGTTINADLGAGLTTAGANIIVDVATGALSTSTVGTQLSLVLDGAGLEQSVAGLKISAAGVTNAMLAHSYFTLNGDTGTTPIDLGDTYEIKGDSLQGITTAITNPDGEGKVTITAANASASQKGVASFTATEFVVTAGNVALGTVANSNLANSTINFTGTSGADTVALGESFAISGTGGITTDVTANAISIDLGTVGVNHGGTGVTSFFANELLIGNGTSAIAQSANLTFDTSTLTIGGALPLAINGNLGSITATATDSDLVLMPNGTGSVIVGPVGAGIIQSDATTALTVRGNTGLTLESGTLSTTMMLASGTTAKVSVSGPTAVDYATGLAANDLTNKQYVDAAIQSGAASGSIKAVKLAGITSGTTHIGAAMPAGATVLSVKVVVTTADAVGTVSVGKTGSIAAYMTTDENDTAATGIYFAETYATEATSQQVIATVTGSTVVTIIVEYQVA